MSFFTTNGLKVFSKSDAVGFLGEGDAVGVDCFGVDEVEAVGAGADVEALGLPKKLDMIDRDFSWASFSFFSFSAFAAFFSNRSFS